MAQQVPLQGPPEQHSSLSPTQGCTWLPAVAASTLRSSTPGGPSPTCLHWPPPLWVLDSGQSLGPLRANHNTACPRRIRVERWLSREGTALATAPPVLPTSSTGNQYVERQPAHFTISGTGTPAGTALRSNIPPATDVPPSPSPAPPTNTLGTQQETWRCPRRCFSKRP